MVFDIYRWQLWWCCVHSHTGCFFLWILRSTKLTLVRAYVLRMGGGTSPSNTHPLLAASGQPLQNATPVSEILGMPLESVYDLKTKTKSFAFMLCSNVTVCVCVNIDSIIVFRSWKTNFPKMWFSLEMHACVQNATLFIQAVFINLCLMPTILVLPGMIFIFCMLESNTIKQHVMLV